MASWFESAEATAAPAVVTRPGESQHRHKTQGIRAVYRDEQTGALRGDQEGIITVSYSVGGLMYTFPFRGSAVLGKLDNTEYQIKNNATVRGNQDLVITLSAGDAGVIGYLDVHGTTNTATTRCIAPDAV